MKVQKWIKNGTKHKEIVDLLQTQISSFSEIITIIEDEITPTEPIIEFTGCDIGIEGDFNIVDLLAIDSAVKVANDSKPITYKSDAYVYSLVEVSAGNDSRRQAIIDICLKEQPRIDLYMRGYFYDRVREQLAIVVTKGLITQEEYEWLDGIIPQEYDESGT